MRAATRPTLVTSLLLTLPTGLPAWAQTPCAPMANPALLDITSAETGFLAWVGCAPIASRFASRPEMAAFLCRVFDGSSLR